MRGLKLQRVLPILVALTMACTPSGNGGPPGSDSGANDAAATTDTATKTDTAVATTDSVAAPVDTMAPDVTRPPADVGPSDTQTASYIGGWPVNPNKDATPDPGFEKCANGVCIGVGSCDPADEEDPESNWKKPTGCSLKDGLQLARWKGYDQHGEMVDMYDFIGDGKPVVLDVGTPFCKPCMSLAAFFSTGDPNHTTVHAKEPLTSYAWWKPEYEVVLDLINNDQIRWITIVWASCDPDRGNPVTKKAAEDWEKEWPHPKIPVLADTDCQFKDYLNVSAMPFISVLDENLVFTTYATNGPSAGMKALVALHAQLNP